MARSFATLSALSAAVALGFFTARAEEKSAEEQQPSALESARRDLKELPALERRTDPRAKLPDTGIQFPGLAPAPGGGGSASASASGNPDTATKSQGWLLDALQKTDEHLRARANERKTGDSATNLSTDQRFRPAENPLSSYLQQWLSPQDRSVLLGQEKARREAMDPFSRAAAPTWNPLGTADVKTTTSNDPLRDPLAPRPNPYLAAMSAESSTFTTDSFAPSAATPPSAPGPTTTSPLLPTMPTYSQSRDTGPKFTPAPEEQLPPPTAPLLDERRYFPQLRRF